jgi:hypothetical protein
VPFNSDATGSQILWESTKAVLYCTTPPGEWEDLGFGPLLQADCHARLGDEEKAVACCERLPEDFWTPGIYESPAGDKTAAAPQRLIASEERRRLASVERSR